MDDASAIGTNVFYRQAHKAKRLIEAVVERAAWNIFVSGCPDFISALRFQIQVKLWYILEQAQSY
jgi:hypothetical protein